VARVVLVRIHARLCCSIPSRNVLIYRITFLRWLQEIRRDVFWKLMILRPLANGVEVFAFVPGIEIDICFRPFRVPPNLAQNSGIDRAHELLANDVQTVS
jgi:hypothetical protein